MKPPSYIGVTGFTSREQVDAALESLPAGKRLMVGVLASQKTLSGGKRNARSPASEDIAGIFSDDSRCINLVHYYTKDTANLWMQLDGAAIKGGACCHGLQIKIPWPSADDLALFSEMWFRVVLQIGPTAWAEMTPMTLVHKLDPYIDVITDVLLDASAGRGFPLDVSATRPMVAAIRNAFPELGISIAGGLCAETLPAVMPLVREFDLSIDAEGRLRTADDELDLDAVCAYLRAAGEP